MLTVKHVKVITTALTKEMSPQALSVVKKACVHSDVPLLYKRINAEHFITTIDEGIEFLNRTRNKVLDELVLASTCFDKSKKDLHIANALYTLGRSEHCGHDAITHTNYIHLKAANIKGCYEYLTGISQKKPSLFKNCELNILKLLSERVNAFKNIKNDPDFYKKVYLSPDLEGKRTSHYLLGLDCEKDIASVLYEKKHGRCGFKIAFNESVKYTTDSWQRIMTSLKERIGEDKAHKLLIDLSNWNPKAIDISRISKNFYKSLT